MTIEAITVIAKTTVDLANIGMLAYGIRSATDFLLAWLDSFPQRDPRTAEQIKQDNEVELNGR